MTRLGGTLADFDVVNMGFRGIVSNLMTREEKRAVYPSYFDSVGSGDTSDWRRRQ
jgi:hypothetical protein